MVLIPCNANNILNKGNESVTLNLVWNILTFISI